MERADKDSLESNFPVRLKVKKLIIKQRKLAEGKWLPKNQWKKSQEFMMNKIRAKEYRSKNTSAMSVGVVYPTPNRNMDAGSRTEVGMVSEVQNSNRMFSEDRNSHKAGFTGTSKPTPDRFSYTKSQTEADFSRFKRPYSWHREERDTFTSRSVSTNKPLPERSLYRVSQTRTRLSLGNPTLEKPMYSNSKVEVYTNSDIQRQSIGMLKGSGSDTSEVLVQADPCPRLTCVESPKESQTSSEVNIPVSLRRWEEHNTKIRSETGEEEHKSNMSKSDQLTVHKMTVTPKAYPSVMFSEEQFEELQIKLLDQLCNEEANSVPLQILSTYLEKGAMIVICSNKETTSWLKTKCHVLSLFGGLGVVAEDYKNLFQSTKIELRLNKFLAKLGESNVLSQVEKQNPGLKTKDWRIICNNREEDFQTLVMSIDDVSAWELKNRDWSIFLGISRVVVKVCDEN